MTLEEAIEQAAKELPEGAEIHIFVEKDAATMSAHVVGDHYATLDSADRTLAEQVTDNLAWCKDQESVEICPNCDTPLPRGCGGDLANQGCPYV